MALVNCRRAAKTVLTSLFNNVQACVCNIMVFNRILNLFRECANKYGVVLRRDESYGVKRKIWWHSELEGDYRMGTLYWCCRRSTLSNIHKLITTKSRRPQIYNWIQSREISVPLNGYSHIYVVKVSTVLRNIRIPTSYRMFQDSRPGAPVDKL